MWMKVKEAFDSRVNLAGVPVVCFRLIDSGDVAKTK